MYSLFYNIRTLIMQMENEISAHTDQRNHQIDVHVNNLCERRIFISIQYIKL